GQRRAARHAPFPCRGRSRRRRAVGAGGAGDVDRRMGAVALLLLIVPAAAQAHDGAAHWSAEPWVVAPLVLAVTLYARGVHRLWRQAGRGRGISRRQVGCFIAGTLSLVTALMSPLDSLGGRYFS